MKSLILSTLIILCLTFDLLRQVEKFNGEYRHKKKREFYSTYHFDKDNFTLIQSGDLLLKMTTQLTDKEYKATMTNKMLDVTRTAEPIVDIWPYVQHLVTDKVVAEYVFDKQLVETVYRNDKNTFDHVLLLTDKPNVFIVIIIDLRREEIRGHFRLDLNKEYGLI